MTNETERSRMRRLEYKMENIKDKLVNCLLVGYGAGMFGMGGALLAYISDKNTLGTVLAAVSVGGFSIAFGSAYIAGGRNLNPSSKNSDGTYTLGNLEKSLEGEGK